SLNQAEQHSQSLNNPTWYAEICNYRARAWLALGQAERADSVCQTAWQIISDQAHLVWAQCLTLITLAQVDLARHHNPLANLNRANELADHYQLHSFQSQIALIRAQYAEQQENWDEALASFKHYRQLDLGELAQHQQQGAREFSSIEFLRLVQQIDAQRRKISSLESHTAPTAHLPHNHQARYLWLQQLKSSLDQQLHLGVVFIRLPLDSERFPWQRKLYLMATICTEHSTFCQYAEGLFAILIPQISADELHRYQSNVGNILQLLPIEAGRVAVAATLSQADDTLVQLLGRVETILYPSSVD
ncbi:MAG: hypothetical protein ACRC01_03680, partial [Deefgea sp.]